MITALVALAASAISMGITLVRQLTGAKGAIYTLRASAGKVG